MFERAFHSCTISQGCLGAMRHDCEVSLALGSKVGISNLEGLRSTKKVNKNTAYLVCTLRNSPLITVMMMRAESSILELTETANGVAIAAPVCEVADSRFKLPFASPIGRCSRLTASSCTASGARDHSMVLGSIRLRGLAHRF